MTALAMLGRKMRSLAAFAGVVASATALGCSADSVDEPEPTLETPGTFVGREEFGEVRIYRTLSTLRLQGDLVLIDELYAVRAVDFAEAKQLAQQPGLKLEKPLDYVPESKFVVPRWQVLWFRSPSREELDRVY